VAVKIIYRLTLVSSLQFNISSSSSHGTINTISTIIDAGSIERFTITSTDNNLARVSVTWYVEFVADMSKLLNRNRKRFKNKMTTLSSSLASIASISHQYRYDQVREFSMKLKSLSDEYRVKNI